MSIYTWGLICLLPAPSGVRTVVCSAVGVWSKEFTVKQSSNSYHATYCRHALIDYPLKPPGERPPRNRSTHLRIFRFFSVGWTGLT